MHWLSYSTEFRFSVLRPFSYRKKKRNEIADIFFGRKIRPENEKIAYSAPKNKKKTKFGRLLFPTYSGWCASKPLVVTTMEVLCIMQQWRKTQRHGWVFDEHAICIPFQTNSKVCFQIPTQCLSEKSDQKQTPWNRQIISVQQVTIRALNRSRDVAANKIILAPHKI